MAEPAIAEHRQADGFVSELEARNLHPLWDRYQRITPIKPQAQDAPFLWRWREVEPFLHRSVAEVSINDIERRALILAHPAFATDTTTTSTLLAAFTVLDPGDRARPHRHTGAAIRFATRAEGAVTIVNGRRCKMQEGDLILTPPMVWHGHINESDHRIIWFDAANMPLIRAVDAHFFEPGDPRNNQFWQVDEGEEALWTEAGLVAEGAAASPVNSPKYHYPGEATRRLLAAAPAGSDGRPITLFVSSCGVKAGRTSAIRHSNGHSTMSSPYRTGPGRGTSRKTAMPIFSWSRTSRRSSGSIWYGRSCNSRR
jgi:gentisate 1,2-dioxygenase